ncbi:MAG: EAL domain-containing protein [Tepidisphaeraceae bacterium]|jgi:diguanylate cyclase (GGDEF)-like protein
MISAMMPANESERLSALRRCQQLDTASEIAFDDLVFLASRVCEAPMAAISLVDEHRQWFKSQVGLGVRQTPREVAFCAHAILQPDLLVVPDALKDERFHDSPLVRNDPHIRFYAGAPLLTADGQAIGALCAMDTVARSLSTQQAEALQALARQVMNQIELRQAQRGLVQAALHDALTGLPNRVLLVDRIEQCIARARSRSGYHFAVLYLDLDRFKVINDSMDHSVGDKLLVAVAQRLTQSVRCGDTVGRADDLGTVARLGGDEFTVVLENLRSPADVAGVAGRLLAELSKPLPFNGQEIVVTASMGVVAESGGAASAAQLLRDADVAMYRAKGAGGNRFAMFDPAMHASATNRMQLENDLRHAIDRGQLVLEYQPIVSLQSLKLQGFEALLRWQFGGELILPEEFVPIAEETGLIVPIGRWIIAGACRQLAEWRRAFAGAPLTMSINLSRRQLADRELIPHVSRTLCETGLEAQSLQLELTESAICAEESARVMLPRLKEMGVHLAMDDFGTGYSSLSCLRDYPLDVLKIDRSFVSGQGSCRDAVTVLKGIVDLAHNLQMRTVAEGIQTMEEAAMLQSVKCDEGQGYLFSPPCSVQTATAWISARLAATEAA